MAVPWLWGLAIDSIGSDAAASRLLGYVALLAGIAVVSGVVRTFSRFVIFNVGRDIEYDLRNDLFAHLETLPLGFYQQRQTGDLMSRLVNDVTAGRLLLRLGIVHIIDTPVAHVLRPSRLLLQDASPPPAPLPGYPVAFAGVKPTSRLLLGPTP